MPYVPKDRIKVKPTPYIHNNKSREFYNTTIWINLRRYFLRKHPFCMLCGDLATDIHHVRAFLKGADDTEKWKLFTDEDNLVSLCDKCHHAIHKDPSLIKNIRHDLDIK